jgi:hypothetical protein
MTFQPGQSGNPGGKAKEKPFRDALNLAIADAGEDRKKLRSIAAKLLNKADSGDIAAIREVADRLDGKPAQENTHDGDGHGGPIKIETAFRWMRESNTEKS